MGGVECDEGLHDNDTMTFMHHRHAHCCQLKRGRGEHGG